MSVERRRGFSYRDRYHFDRKYSENDHWFQVDTRNDASYYGTWCNPAVFAIFSFCEGDTTFTQCDSRESFIEEMRSCEAHHRQHEGWIGVDLGGARQDLPLFAALGLEDLLH